MLIFSKNNILIILCLCILLFIANFSNTEEFKPLKNKKIDWPFKGITGSFDIKSIQLGYKVYREICATCHSMNRISFRNLKDIGFSEDDVKQIASSYQIKDGPNDSGDMFYRPGVPSDYFVNPFSSKELASASNNGVVPPDLSLIIKARKDGANYVYSLLTGYQSYEPDENGLYANFYFPTGKLAMSPPLFEGIIKYGDKKEATIENIAYDIVNFLHWASEPELEKRHKLGFKVITYFVILTFFFILTNNKIWAKIYKK